MVEFSKNKWKYSTIGLLAVLAVGFSFPQASAHITNSVQHVVTDIYNFVDTEVAAIKAKTDNLPTDPASNSVVNTRANQSSVDNLQTTANAIKVKTDTLPSDPADQSDVEAAITSAKNEINTNTNDARFNQVISRFIHSPSATQDEVECTSDQAYVLYINWAPLGAGGHTDIGFDPSIDGAIGQTFIIDQTVSMTIPRSAGDTTTITAVDSDPGFSDFVTGWVTLQTAEGATASCERS